MLLQQQGGGARYMGCRHRSAGSADVVVVHHRSQRRAGGPRRGDQVSGSDDLGLHREIVQARPTAGEEEHRVRQIDGAHRERLVRGTGAAHGLRRGPRIARGNDE